jgi:hypothetical protein
MENNKKKELFPRGVWEITKKWSSITLGV